MEPRIETFTGKRYVGKRIIMSFYDNRTVELWKNFMPRRREIENNIGTDLYSIEVYTPQFFDNFNVSAEFEKWAAIEVTDFRTIPDEMETITLPDGLYAVFVHKGPASSGPETYQYIFGTWLPNSGFLLDNRPHFALMGQKYKKEDPNSEEELWIPIKPKK
jgi:AraC family transcriptional regulator